MRHREMRACALVTLAGRANGQGRYAQRGSIGAAVKQVRWGVGTRVWESAEHREGWGPTDGERCAGVAEWLSVS